MALLQCEICGGKLIGKPGGLFECEYCGVQYDTAWAKGKIQEIKGTVKVEGTVEVQGRVKIDGPVKVEGGVNIESLLKRGQMALADEDWEKAEDFFEEALKMDAERSECYWGILCAKYQFKDADSLLSAEYDRLRNDKDLARAVKYADKKLQNQIAVLEKQYAAQDVVGAVQSGESLLKQNPYLARILPAQHLVACTADVVVAVKTDGTVMACIKKSCLRSDLKYGEILCAQLKSWENIVAISARHRYVVGLKADGTVVAASSYTSDFDAQLDVSGWTDIVAIDAGSKRTLGLKRDGTIVAAGKEYHPDPLTMIIRRDLSDWKNMAVAGHLYLTDYGIRKDGSIVLGDWITKDSDEVKSVRRWKNIVALAACYGGTGSMARCFVGLRPDGTLLLPDGRCFGKNVAALYTSDWGVFALDKDGNVYKVRFDGNFENYLMGQDVVAIAPQEHDLVCLKANGTLVRRTSSSLHNDFEGWKLFESVDTIEQERQRVAGEKARREEEARETDYQRALDLLDNGIYASDVDHAAYIFEQLLPYRDTAEKLSLCLVKIRELQKEEKYRAALAMMQETAVSSVGKAQQEFKSLGEWKDSQEKAAQCVEKIKMLKKQAEEKEKREVEKARLCDHKKQLENERNKLGIFSSKRKKEINAEIQQIDNAMAMLDKESI